MRLRFALICESARIQSDVQRNQTQQQKTEPPILPSSSRSAGRPTALAKAGEDKRQRTLNWSETNREEDRMDEA